jgi:hypothetical protein
MKILKIMFSDFIGKTRLQDEIDKKLNKFILSNYFHNFSPPWKIVNNLKNP